MFTTNELLKATKHLKNPSFRPINNKVEVYNKETDKQPIGYIVKSKNMITYKGISGKALLSFPADN